MYSKYIVRLSLIYTSEFTNFSLFVLNRVFVCFIFILTFLFTFGCSSKNDNETPIPKKITISFNTQGGNPIYDQNIIEGAKLTTKPKDPTKINHQFKGWFTTKTGLVKVNLEIEIFTANTTIYAQWTQIAFLISFDLYGEGASGKPKNQIIQPNNIATKPTTIPERYGYIFLGWYQSETPDNNDKPFDFSKIITQDLILYGKWTQIFFITYNSQGGSYVERKTVTYNRILKRPTNDPTRPHYTFDNWYTTAATDGHIVTFPYTVTGNRMFYARWKRIQYTVTFNPNYTDAQTTEKKVNSGESTNALERQPNRNHYTFDNWYTTAKTDGEIVNFPYTVTENRIFYARWTKYKYNVVFNPNYTDAQTTEMSFKIGELTNALDPQPIRNHYTFDNWYTTAKTAGEIVNFPYTVTGNITFYARWTRIQHTITFNPNYKGGQLVEVIVNSGDTTNALLKPVRNHFTFVNWYTSPKTTGEIANFPYTVTENTTLYASWTRIQYTITFNLNYTGTQTTEVTIKSGETASPLTTEPTRTGAFSFLNWHESSSETEILLYTEPFNFKTIITANKILYAKWTEGYVISFDTQGGSIVNAQEILATRSPKRAIRPNINPTRDCYIFDNWYENSSPTHGETAFNFDSDITTSKKTLYARWTKVIYNVSFNFNYIGATTPYPTRTTDSEGKIVATTPTTPTGRDATHTLKGWYTLATGGDKIDFTSQTFCSDTEVFAHWLFY